MSEHTGDADQDSGGMDLSQFHAVFFEEAAENLGNMEGLLLEIDTDDPDQEELNAIFRCAHSIKGGAATFGFSDVADLTHVMETLLDRLRRSELTMSSDMVDTLLQSGDALTTLLARHAGTSDEVFDSTGLVEIIRAQANGDAASTASADDESEKSSKDRHLSMVFGSQVAEDTIKDVLGLFEEVGGLGSCEPDPVSDGSSQPGHRFIVRTQTNDDELFDLFQFHVNRDEVTLSEEISSGQPAVTEQNESADSEGWGLFEDETAKGEAASVAPASVVSTPAKSAASTPQGSTSLRARKEEKKTAKAKTPETSTLRVSVEKVDQLINIVGELVITQAMLAQTGRSLDPIVHQKLMANLVDLERNTRLLQESVMGIRMIPMAVVFNRFPRMLRDLAGKLGKKIELTTIGEATELDKGMIEKITDPLTHLVRNAADHGIEIPSKREAVGKIGKGTITLSATHRGGSIVIDVRDDGNGLSREKLLEKASENGMLVDDSMTDNEVWNLIFEPGFSTADEVTDVSGRGVGMDVVRRNIQGLGGSVEITSAPGYGTCVSVRLPLTLAIMDGMSVGVGSDTYILPLGSVVESINLDLKQVKNVGGSNQVLEVRGEYLPVLRLEDVVPVERQQGNPGNQTVIVVEADGQRVAMLVDELIGQHQIVVKNLETNYRKVNGVSGATIMGDGRVALILDVSHLVRRSRH